MTIAMHQACAITVQFLFILGVSICQVAHANNSISSDSIPMKPNLVIFYVDDLGYGDLSSYGHPIVKTPIIDQLANEGIKYTQYYAPAPLCSPSRAGLLTGRTPYRTGIRSWIPEGQDVYLGKNEITIAHLLKNVGYQTAVMGKLHLNGGIQMDGHPQTPEMGFDHGFVMPGGFVKNTKVELPTEDGSPRVGKMYPDNFYRNGAAVGETNAFSGELVADEVIDWLSQIQRKKPFFLYIPFSEVHTPVASTRKYLEMYSDYITPHAKSNPEIFHLDWLTLAFRGQGEYYANISYLDAQVGKVIGKLKSMGVYENTIVIFTSDNGPVTRESRKPWELFMAGETGGFRGRKDNLLEGGIRVPAIIRYPAAIDPGTVSNEPVYGLDFLPTLAEMIGFKVPGDRVIDGQSITETFKGRMLDRKPMIWTIDMPSQDNAVNEWAYRVGDHKLIFDRNEKPKFLFDLKQDPWEMVNLVKKEKELVAKLEQEFQALKLSIETDPVNDLR
jgi:arylsulfatase A-like enzyme